MANSNANERLFDKKERQAQVYAARYCTDRGIHSNSERAKVLAAFRKES